jgi:hypothetical protein
MPESWNNMEKVGITCLKVGITCLKVGITWRKLDYMQKVGIP